MVELNQTRCELAFQLTYNPIYRIAQIWSFLVSFFAIPLLLYFIFKKVSKLPFHGNLKFLLNSYFIGTLLFATVTCFDFGYHTFIPFFATSKCDLIISPSLFKYEHLSALIFMVVPMTLPVGFTIERFVALKMAHSYESIRTLLGPLLFFTLVIIDCTILYAIYYNDPFTDNFISFILIPSTAAYKFNLFFWGLVITKFTNFSCNCVLLMVHKRMHRNRCHSSSLSAKYEMEEISQSSRFTLIVTFSHLLFFGWYVCSILFIRTVGQDFFGGYINYTVARGVYCATPTYNLVIGFIGFKALSHLNLKRNNKVASTIQIKSTGDEGAKNYDNAISSYWDSVYSGRDKIKF